MMDLLDELMSDMTDTINVSNEGGRGRKQCPACKVFVGVRTHNCVCGYDFYTQTIDGGEYKKFEPPRDKEYDRTLSLFDNFNSNVNGLCVVYTPAGKCPIKFNPGENPLDNVESWCRQVMSAGEKIGKAYSPLALKYFLREWYSFSDSVYKDICRKIDSFVRE